MASPVSDITIPPTIFASISTMSAHYDQATSNQIKTGHSYLNAYLSGKARGSKKARSSSIS